MRRLQGVLAGTLALVLAAWTMPGKIAAQQLEVSYVEGLLEVKSSEGWMQLDIGDTVSGRDTLRFDGDGVAELAGEGGVTVMLREGGLFTVAALLKQSRQVSSWKIDSLVASRVSGFLHSESSKRSAVMGVRGAEAGGGKGSRLMGGEPADASRMLEQARDLIRNGHAREAEGLLEDLLEFCDEEEEPEVYLVLGYARLVQGKRAAALDALSQAEMEPGDRYWEDLVVVRGQLLMESLAFQEALQEFSRYREQGGGGATLQLVGILSARCEMALGRKKAAVRELQAVVEQDAESEYGRQATALLREMGGEE